MRISLVALSLSLISTAPAHAQSSDPVLEKSGVKLEHSEDKISDSDTKKAVFEKKGRTKEVKKKSAEPAPSSQKAETKDKKEPEEPGTWEKVKEKSGEAYEYSKEKAGEAVDYGAEKSKDLRRSLGAARERRGNSQWTFTGNYSLFEMWVLTKYGVTVGYNRSPSSTYEFEYMRGSLGFGYFGLDIGKISEERFALLWRSYGRRNSFSFVSGLYYNKLDVHLGSDLLASVSGQDRAKVDIMELQTVGLSWGVGNRWQTSGGFVWGADWLVLNVPVWIVKQEHPFIDSSNSAEARDDANDTMRILRRIPAVAALKIQLGVSF